MNVPAVFKKKTTWLVIAVIACFLFFVSKEAKAETFIELAPASVFVGGHHFDGASVLMMTERFAGKYDASIILLVNMNENGRDSSNRGVQLMRTAQWRDFEVGIGYAWWANESAAWTATSTFSLTLGWHITDRWTLRERHFSTGGTSTENSGLDMLTLSYGF